MQDLIEIRKLKPGDSFQVVQSRLSLSGFGGCIGRQSYFGEKFIVLESFGDYVAVWSFLIPGNYLITRNMNCRVLQLPGINCLQLLAVSMFMRKKYVRATRNG